MESPMKGMSLRFGVGTWPVGRLIAALLLAGVPLTLSAQQVSYPLGSRGSMGLGSPNGEFSVAQDDLSVKVPGGYVRINRDYDGRQWVFNRQWSGLGRPSYYQGSYASIGSFPACNTIDGVSSCDTTASSGQVVLLAPILADHLDEVRIIWMVHRE